MRVTYETRDIFFCGKLFLISVMDIVHCLNQKKFQKIGKTFNHPLSKEQTSLIWGAGVKPVSGSCNWRAFKFPKGAWSISRKKEVCMYVCMYVCIGFISLKHGYTFINEKRIRSQCEISTMLNEWMLQWEIECMFIDYTLVNTFECTDINVTKKEKQK